MQRENYCLILFDKKYCIKQSVNYIFSLKFSKDNIKILSNIIIYLLILACEEFLKIFNISLVYTKTKDRKILLNNKNNIID